MDELKTHLMVFLLYYNHQRPLKSLKLKTPWQFIENAYNESPDLFNKTPHQMIVGLNRYLISILANGNIPITVLRCPNQDPATHQYRQLKV